MMKEVEAAAEEGCRERDSKRLQKIMITGCDRELRTVLEYALGSYGVQPLFCEYGNEALQSTAIRAYDYILVDRDTPGIDGIELARRLRERFPLAIIIGMDAKETEAAFLRAGANDFLRKPFVPYRLAMMISGADILA